MANVTYRWANAQDRERVHEVLCRGFHLLRGSSKWRMAQQLVESHYKNFRTILLDDEIIGIAHLSHHQLQVGKALLELGYIGQVAVVPELQDLKFGTRLLENLLEEMAEDGYHIARLSGLVRFYERFGWTPFPRRFVEFPLRRVRAGTAEVSVADMLEVRGVPEGAIREYRPEDRRQREALLRRFQRHRTGVTRSLRSARSSPIHEQAPSEWQFVYQEGDRLLGYLAIHVFPEDVSDFEAAVHLREAAFDLSRPDAVAALVRHVLAAAHQRGAQRVTARLPWDPHLLGILRSAGLMFEQVELMNAVAGNMLRLVDFASLIQQILPELSDRWTRRHLTQGGVLRLAVGNAEVRLDLRGEGVKLAPSRPEARWSVEISTFDFLRLLLGLGPAESVAGTVEPSGESVGVLNALFPCQPTACGAWG